MFRDECLSVKRLKKNKLMTASHSNGYSWGRVGVPVERDSAGAVRFGDALIQVVAQLSPLY